MTHRNHFHALITVLPTSAVSEATCFSWMKIWEGLQGGIARVRVYDSSLSGVEYVLKGVDEAYFASGANWYELGKFGARCDVMLSLSLTRRLQNRGRFGPRDRDGLFSDRRRGFHARRRARLGDELEGDKHAGNTVQTVVREMRRMSGH